MARERRMKPWEKPNPKRKAGKASTKLSPGRKAEARARAKEAGRPYPNLVDNMRAAADQRSHGH